MCSLQRILPVAAVVLSLAGIERMAAQSRGQPAPALPAAWQALWTNPPASCRPMQIVHRLWKERAGVEGMKYYCDRGLGGIVCNVDFDQYLRNEAHWKALVERVEACRQLRLRVWLYDEDGYPSGAAGGLVLAGNRAFEAQELAYDATRPDPFVLRPAYEHTHASNNYACSRRYINLIDDRAVAAFLNTTHDAYWQRLGPQFGPVIEGVFTDEPSLIAVNIGQLPEKARSHVKVADPLDPNVQPLPAVPWCYDIQSQYRGRYGSDLLPQRKSLFMGDTPDDRRVRRQFWALVADLVSDRYFGQIQRWCHAHRIASSGHTLAEEQVYRHTPLDGDKLKALSRMDIPGMDMLSSDPEMGVQIGWLTASLPSSAATLQGRRQVMTEIGDFSQRMTNQPPAALPEMQATAAWQAAWGVTEFKLYYQTEVRSLADYRAYTDYVGRLNAILRPAVRESDVLLYYPIYDLWAEYRPVAEPLLLPTQSPRTQRLVNSFTHLGRSLAQAQVPFTLVDHEHLDTAKLAPGPELLLGSRKFRALVLPDGAELSPASARVVEDFRKAGGPVVTDVPPRGHIKPANLLAALHAPYRLEPASVRLVLGRYQNDGRRIVLLGNMATTAYEGRMTVDSPAGWWQLDPARGTIQQARHDNQQALVVNLAPRQALIFVQQ